MVGRAVDTMAPSRELRKAVMARHAKTAQKRQPRFAIFCGDGLSSWWVDVVGEAGPGSGLVTPAVTFSTMMEVVLIMGSVVPAVLDELGVLGVWAPITPRRCLSRYKDPAGVASSGEGFVVDA